MVDEENGRLYFEKIDGGSVKEYLRAAYKLGTRYEMGAHSITLV